MNYCVDACSLTCVCVCVCVCASALLTTSSSVNHPDELPHVDLLCMCVHFSPWTRFSPSPTLEIHNLFTCCFLMEGHCHIWTSLIEFSSVALSWFTLSGLTIFIMSESSFNPFFSASWVGEIVNNLLNVSHAVPSFFITVICVTCCFFLMFYHCPMCHMLFLPHVLSLSYVSHAVSSSCFITVLCVTCCFFPMFFHCPMCRMPFLPHVLSLSYVSHAVSSPMFYHCPVCHMLFLPHVLSLSFASAFQPKL